MAAGNIGQRRSADIVTGVQGLRVLVTGGASGIGLATAHAFTSQGAQVVVLDRTTAPNGDSPGEPHSVLADVTDDQAVVSAVEQAAGLLDGIDILVNNAGIGAQGDVSANDLDEWRRVLDVNLLGAVRVSRAALPYLRSSANAAIVNICSIAATAGLPQRALYSASKGAVYSLTLAMAADHLREGIRVNGINPGTADTPWVEKLLQSAADPAAERAALEARQPHGRLVSADEIAAAVVFLAGPGSGSTTGTFLAVDGGMHGLRLRPQTT